MKILTKPRTRSFGKNFSKKLMAFMSIFLLLGQFAPALLWMSPTVSAVGGLTPLHLSSQNSRYFEDANGKLVYLTGSHTWANGSDNGDGLPPPTFDYTAYLNYIQARGHNFVRYWRWEQTRWSNETADDNYWFGLQPYVRTTGQGNALDGFGKFDLTQWNDAYFQQLRQRVSQANDRGIYVSVMLFNGWSVSCKGAQFCANQPFKGHPFNAANNINGINGDTNGDGGGEETQTLANPQIVALDDAYIKKVSDTIGDLPNVLYEVSNESNGGAANRDWQYHIIDTLHSYEESKYKNANGIPYHHPIGFSMQFPNANLTYMYNSNAEWIAFGGDINNPGVNNSGKVQFGDTDHQCGSCGGSADWAWKDFTRGLNPLQMDIYDGVGFGTGAGLGGNKLNDPTWENTRYNMGKTLAYANRLDLAHAVPSTTLCSTQYCLANPTNGSAQFITYNPSGGSFTVNLAGITGTLNAEWYNPATLASTPVATPVSGGTTSTFTAPFSGPSVLYLTQVTAPTVTLGGVANGSAIKGTAGLTASVTNGGNVASVIFQQNGTTIATVTSAPYAANWDTTTVADGSYQLAAVALDANGATLATSPVLTVTVNNYVPTPPSLTITAPAASSTLTGATNTVSADASDSEGIQDVSFYLDNTLTGTSTLIGTATTAPYQVNLDTTSLANGSSYNIRVVARDTHLTPTTQTEPVTVYNPDVTPPTATLTGPANGSVVKGTVAVTAAASDQSGIANVVFYVDGAQAGQASTAPYTFSWNTASVLDGTHQVYAIAYDTAGNSTQTATSTVTTHNAAPTVSVTNAAGTVSGTVSLSATASDSIGISSVSYYYGSTLIGGSSTAPYAVSWNTAATANGAYQVTAVATNTVGTSATSAPVSMTVTNQVASIPGLLAAYGFTTAATANNDASGLGNTLTCGTVCPTFTTSGHSGGAYDFSGSNNLAVIPNPSQFNLTGGMTIEFWMKEGAWSKTWENIIVKGNDTYSVGRYGSNNLADFSTSGILSGKTTSWDNKSVSNPATGTWHHVAVTWDGTNKKIYVDGTLELTYAWNRALLTNTQNLTLGGNAQNMTSEYGGQLDDVRIYSRALAASEITTDMNTPVN